MELRVTQYFDSTFPSGVETDDNYIAIAETSHCETASLVLQNDVDFLLHNIVKLLPEIQSVLLNQRHKLASV